MKGFRWKRWVFGILLIIVIGALADLLGWNIRGWFKELWDTITTISIEYVVGGLRAADRADDHDGVRVVLDPPLRLSRTRACAGARCGPPTPRRSR